jgi:O-acetylserine/cysteine efflux transporter
MQSRFSFLLQALFTVFLWSISKIVLKMGLTEIPPYFFLALIQVIALVALGIYAWFKRREPRSKLLASDIQAAALSGFVGFVGANLFVVIGLQYVTGAAAGLIAASSSIFAVLMSVLFLKERPRAWQYLGIGLILAGSYVFLSDQVVGGSMVGVGLLILAEMAFAFSGSLTRLVNERHEKNISLTLSLIGNLIGVIVLVPLALLVDGIPQINWTWQVGTLVLVSGLIFAFGGLMWNAVLDKLQLVEASVINNTMVIQVAILSVVFLRESLSVNDIFGGLIVVLGALITDVKLILPPAIARSIATRQSS